MRLRLSALMFLQYAVMGAWVPLFSLILSELGFSPGEVARTCATAALGALLAPLLWGQIADRWFAAQHCISFCAGACGTLLWVLSYLATPGAMFAAALGYWFFMVPVVTLGTSLTFRNLRHPESDFGPVRMWGTVGWVAPNLLLGCWFADSASMRTVVAFLRPGQPVSELADAFRLGGILAFILSAYAWTLPHTPPSPRRTTDADSPRGWFRAAFEAPLLAAQLFRQRSFFVYCLCLMGLYITIPFSSQLTPLLLSESGVARSWLPATLTIAQSLEVATLALLPRILSRLEVKGTLLLGVCAWTAALAILSVGQPAWLVVASLGLHGVFITCFLVAGQVFVNRRAQQDVRASAQAILHFLNGIGMLAGNLVVGSIRSASGGQFVPAFLTATILSGGLVIVLLLGFRKREE
jgi:hypothetical protein